MQQRALFPSALQLSQELILKKLRLSGEARLTGPASYSFLVLDAFGVSPSAFFWRLCGVI